MKFTQRTQSSHELYLFSIEVACITVNNRFCFFVCSLDFVFLFFFCFYETMFLLTLFALLMAGDIVLIMQRKARH